MRPAYCVRIQSSLKRLARIHGDLGEVFADAGRQWLDPGVVLLFWQVVAELFNTGQPQPLTRVVQGIFGHSEALGIVDRN